MAKLILQSSFVSFLFFLFFSAFSFLTFSSFYMSLPLLVLSLLFVRRNGLLLNDVVFVYVALVFSGLVVIRDLDAGLPLGYGPDMFRYLRAFYEIENGDPVFFAALSRTGSAEPVFWGGVKLLSLFGFDAYQIWFFLNFIICFLIYFSIRRISPSFALVLACMYFSTRTFHVFGGSAIRQGFAQAIFCLGLSYVYSGSRLKAIAVSSLAPLSHLSGLFAVLSVFLGQRFNRLNVRLFLQIIIALLGVLVASFLVLKFAPDSFLSRKVTARFLVENKEEGGYGWLLQFIIESGCVFFALKLFCPGIFRERIWISFVFLCFLIVAFIPFNYVSIRLYRYTYCYYIYFALYVFLLKKQQLYPVVIFVLFFLYWQINLATKYYPLYGYGYVEAVMISPARVVSALREQKRDTRFLQFRERKKSK